MGLSGITLQIAGVFRYSPVWKGYEIYVVSVSNACLKVNRNGVQDAKAMRAMAMYIALLYPFGFHYPSPSALLTPAYWPWKLPLGTGAPFNPSHITLEDHEMKNVSPFFLPVALSFFIAFFFTGCSEQAAANKLEAAALAVKMKELSQDEYLAQLQKKADSGNAEAQFDLGWIYMHGEGYTGITYMRDVPKDSAKAYDWYQKAAIQGHVKAQYNLGMLYRLGLGIKENPESAFIWLQKAAAQGYDIAQYNVGLMYADGTGVERHLPHACAWLALAAAQGNEKAKKSYLDLGATLTPKQRAEGQQLAIAWKKGEVI